MTKQGGVVQETTVETTEHHTKQCERESHGEQKEAVEKLDKKMPSLHV